MALAGAGFSVEAVCPRGHFLASTTAVKRLHHYGAIGGVSSLRTALLKANPAIIIPCDDPARNHLHLLYDAGQACSRSKEICDLIQRSLGDPLSFAVVESRSRLLALARQEGAAALETTGVSSSIGLRDWLRANGFPAVLKTDGSSGGYGVRVVSSSGEAEVALSKLSAPPGLARALKRALVNRNETFLLPAWKGACHIVSVQKFINGAEATSTAVCWQGTVLATLTFETLRVAYPRGPATVVRLIENQTIGATVRKIIARLGLSGIYGFDFMIENGTGISYLIEMNPRATQTAHLQLGSGRDAAGALFAAVTGNRPREPVNEVKNDTIALFPQEWMREPASEFLRSAFHDVPWSEPALLQAIIAAEGKRL
jgi:hypothetical protein